MIEPFRCMKPEKISVLPTEYEGKCYQEKIDGANSVVEVELPIVRVFHARWDTANTKGQIFTNRNYRYPDLVGEIQEGRVLRNHAVYIGELTVLDEHGTGKQKMFMKRQVEGWKITQLSKHLPILFYPHHIIQYDGQMTNDLTYEEILRLLGQFVHEGKHIRHIPTFNRPEPLLEQKNRGIEGIVVKELHGQYHFGKRGMGWSKMKFLHEKTVKFISYETKDVGINLFTDDNKEVHLAGERVRIAVTEIDSKGVVMAEIEFLEETPIGYRDASIKRIGELAKVEI